MCVSLKAKVRNTKFILVIFSGEEVSGYIYTGKVKCIGNARGELIGIHLL